MNPTLLNPISDKNSINSASQVLYKAAFIAPQDSLDTSIRELAYAVESQEV